MNKERFFQIYNSLTDEERKEICLYNNGYPYSWLVVYYEILNNTYSGKIFLKDIENFERQVHIK